MGAAGIVGKLIKGAAVINNYDQEHNQRNLEIVSSSLNLILRKIRTNKRNGLFTNKRRKRSQQGWRN